jgi:hypothetical protein
VSEPSINLDASPPYVRGAHNRAYNVTGGVKAVDKYLHQLRETGALPDHPDYNLLLDARAVLVERERTKEDA